MYTNVSTLFAEGVKNIAATPDALTGLDDRTLSHPTDSHPPLGVRLQNLGVNLDDVKLSALVVAPENPAIDSIDDHETREKRLSDAEHYLLAQLAGISIGDGADQPPPP